MMCIMTSDRPTGQPFMKISLNIRILKMFYLLEDGGNFCALLKTL